MARVTTVYFKQSKVISFIKLSKDQDVNAIVKNLIFSLHYMSFSVDFADSDIVWLKLFTLRLLENNYAVNGDINDRVVMFIFLSKIMSSSELARFKWKNEFTLKIVQMIKSLSSKIVFERFPNRMSVCSSEIYERVECVYLAASGGLVISLLDLLDCVYELSSKEVLSWELIKNLDLAGELKTIMENGNECEVEHTLKVTIDKIYQKYIQWIKNC